VTHPPSGPHTPPPPSGPRIPKHTHPRVKPLDPDSPEGQAATEALSAVLGDIYLAILRRRAAAQQPAA
jgi:hypothetical protein